MRRLKIEDGNYKLALAQAYEFYLNADIYLSEMSSGYQQAGEYAFHNQTKLFVAATNLALSIELGFKGILLYANSDIPSTHKIDLLFEELNEKTRNGIEEIYEKKRAATPPEKLIRIYLVHKSKLDVKGGHKDCDIKSVLNRNSDNFISFRYIYETVEDKSFTKILEFSHLKIIVTSTLEYCKENGIEY